MNHKAKLFFLSGCFFIVATIHTHKLPMKPLKAQSLHEAWKQQIANVLYKTEFKDYFKRQMNKLDPLKSFTSIEARRAFLHSQWHIKDDLKTLKHLIDMNINQSKSFTDNLVFPVTDQSGKGPSEQNLNLFNNFSNLFASTTKRWVQYIDYFLWGVIKVYIFQENNSLAHMETFARYVMHTAWDFRQISSTTYTLYRQRRDCFTENTISIPIGNLIKHESYPENYTPDKMFCSYSYKCDPCGIIGRETLVNTVYVANCHVYIFTLDKYLKIFLQFHRVYLELVSLHTCSIGTLNISSMLSGKALFSLNYCGIYSNIPAYLPHKDVTVTVSLWLWVSHTINFSFRVISSLLQVSSLPLKNLTTSLVWHLHLAMPERHFGLFEVMTDKYNVIFIFYNTLKASSTIVFNGPGGLSEQFHLIGRGSFQTASFHCQIPFCSPNTLTDLLSMALKYIAISNNNTKQIVIQGNSTIQISYPHLALPMHHIFVQLEMCLCFKSLENQMSIWVSTCWKVNWLTAAYVNTMV